MEIKIYLDRTKLKLFPVYITLTQTSARICAIELLRKRSFMESVFRKIILVFWQVVCKRHFLIPRMRSESPHTVGSRRCRISLLNMIQTQ